MAGYRSSGPTLKSVRKTRVTTIRDILKEIEEDDARARACSVAVSVHDGCRGDDGSVSGSNASKDSGIVTENESPPADDATKMGGPRQIVVHVPSASASKPTKKRESIKFYDDANVEREIDETRAQTSNNRTAIHTNRTSCISSRNMGTKPRKSVSVCEGLSKQDAQTHHRDQRSLSDGHVLGDMFNDSKTEPTGDQDKTKLAEGDTRVANRRGSDTDGLRGLPSDSASLSEIEEWESLAFGMDGIHFLPKLMTERGSYAFHNVMDEMKQEMKKKKQRREGFKTAIRMSMMFKSIGEKRSREREEGLTMDTDSDVSDDDGSDDPDAVESAPPRSFRRMSRGWKLLSMVMKEQHMERKKSETPDGWNLLTRTIGHMTNEEKARQELYERYIYKPNSWAEGLVNYPKFLQERQYNAALLRTKPTVKTRPITAHPSTHNTAIYRPMSGQRVPQTSDMSKHTTHRKPSPRGRELLKKRPKSGPI